MPSLRIDRQESTTLFEQVAAEIRRAIADGEARPGERLPPAVDLAAELGVNKNTVFRALRLLRDEGLVDFTRGRGVRVTGAADRARLIATLDEFMKLARSHGFRDSDVITLVRSRFHATTT